MSRPKLEADPFNPNASRLDIMALYLVRHGETDWNRQKRFQSITDIPLNDKGRAQARAIHAVFRKRGIEFTHARSSPLSRAVETAKIILEDSDTPFTPEPTFMEISLGDFEGQLEADLRKRMGPAYDAWRDTQYTVAPPNGESILQGAERVYDALMALKASAIAGDVLIVAHQAVNMAMKVAISGRSDISSAASFRQSNDEVEVWDMAQHARIDQFKVEVL